VEHGTGDTTTRQWDVNGAAWTKDLWSNVLHNYHAMLVKKYQQDGIIPGRPVPDIAVLLSVLLGLLHAAGYQPPGTISGLFTAQGNQVGRCLKTKFTRSTSVATAAHTITNIVHSSETVAQFRAQLLDCRDPSKTIEYSIRKFCLPADRHGYSDATWTKEMARREAASAREAGVTQEHVLSECNNPNCQSLRLNPDLMRCTRCKIAQYCSRECQREHWSIHKQVCSRD